MPSTQQSYGSMASTSDVEFTRDKLSVEINKLCDNVVTNVYTINKGYKTLEANTKTLGTPKDSLGLRDKIHVTQMSTNQIISETTLIIQRLNVLVRKEKQHKLQIAKLTDDFREAVERYHALQKLAAEKMKAHLIEVTHHESYSEASEDNFQRQIQLSRELTFEHDMLLDREDRIRKIEADVIDVNQIMRDLSTLVTQQGENIDSIENQIDYAVGNVEAGTSEIIKAESYQNRRRRTLLILALIAIVIAAILIAVIVNSLKK